MRGTRQPQAHLDADTKSSHSTATIFRLLIVRLRAHPPAAGFSTGENQVKDIVLQGIELETEMFKDAVDALKPAKVLFRRSDPSLRVCGVADNADLSALEALALAHQVDCIAVPADFSIKAFKVWATDMDSTLTQNECIDDMAFAAGCGDEVARVTKEAMHGAWSFTESLEKRVSLLKGTQASVVIDHAIRRERLTYGAEALIKLCRRHGIATYIVSGGFVQIARDTAKELGMTGAVCNELVIDANGMLTGEVRGPAGGRILDADGKRRAVEVLAQIAGADMSQVICSGDGANDVEMVSAAGLGVAFHPKPVLASHAKAVIRFGGLDVLAHLFKECWVDAVRVA